MGRKQCIVWGEKNNDDTEYRLLRQMKILNTKWEKMDVVRNWISIKTVMLYEYVFVLIQGLGYGTASDYPQLITMISLML